MNQKDIELIRSTIVDIPDYPKPGIIFKDLTPILKSKEVFATAIRVMADEIARKFPGATHIVSPESRGYWFGCAVAAIGGYGFIPLRKPGKLPRKCISTEYDLEYGKETLCVHSDALTKGDMVVIVDDILATGGTLVAAKRLIDELGAECLGYSVLLELSFLKGAENLDGEIISVVVD